MLSTHESKDAVSSNGLCISGLSSDSTSADISLPGLPTSSTLASTWSNEYCGPSGSHPSRDATTHSAASQSQQDDIAIAAAAAVAAMSVGGVHCSSTDSLSSSRRRNTLAGSSASSRIALERDIPDDPFSPPSTAYFAFLNRPARSQRNHFNPADMDSVDPLELPSGRAQHPHHPLAEPETPSFATAPSSMHERSPSQVSSGLSGNVRFFEGIDPSVSSFEIPDQNLEDYATVADEDDDDTNGMDVALVDEGREASGSEVMEHSAPDFPDAPSIHSRRGSVQVMPMPSLPEGVAASTAALSMASTSSSPINATMPMIDFASMGVAPLGSNNVGNARFGGRRASMPSNRLEM
ncbi:hypothetical protein BGZ72_004497 [Mortierella alpina]|nr:hypothetical protein BGZ72_004497 [Mortierella alpina]